MWLNSHGSDLQLETRLDASAVCNTVRVATL